MRDDIPVCCKPYSIPLKLIEETKREIERLIELKVIRKSYSSYCSPAFTIPKSNGKLRLVVDYRILNEKTIPMMYPFPNIQDYLNQLHGSKIFSTIDMNCGYYQIKMKESDIHKTAFSILNNQYEFTRMPFGLKGAPFTFQRSIQNVLGHLPYVKVFIDDILIHSNTVELHETHVTNVLKILKNQNISINFNKSEFYKKEVKYLGHVISTSGIRPDITKLPHYKLLKSPKTKKQLQKILGYFNWFRNFIPNMSKITAPLTNKLQKDNKFIWTVEDTKKLDILFKELEKHTELTFPDPNKNFQLFTDASETGTGAILKQDSKIISYYSYKFNKVEMRYNIVEKEMLSIIKALKNFKTIVFAAKVEIFTDNRNNTFNTNLTNKRCQR